MFAERLTANGNMENTSECMRTSLREAYERMNTEYGQEANFDFLEVWEKTESWMNQKGL